ncbi:flocculation protein FLO11-like [Thrips palmi]|uniref:Flocculation protein FLO11-like n=1 Tax=Thrips palmi TaxID=161013 RepID=A0A6P8Z4F3_THRPL|nr:flocculation protein FLO11-like [Thrips palmi]
MSKACVRVVGAVLAALTLSCALLGVIGQANATFDIGAMHYEGEACFHLRHRKMGTCVYLPSCPTVYADLDRLVFPQVCGFSSGKGLVPNVCCIGVNYAATPPPPPPPPPQFSSGSPAGSGGFATFAGSVSFGASSTFNGSPGSTPTRPPSFGGQPNSGASSGSAASSGTSAFNTPSTSGGSTVFGRPSSSGGSSTFGGTPTSGTPDSPPSDGSSAFGGSSSSSASASSSSDGPSTSGGSFMFGTLPGGSSTSEESSNSDRPSTSGGSFMFGTPGGSSSSEGSPSSGGSSMFGGAGGSSSSVGSSSFDGSASVDGSSSFSGASPFAGASGGASSFSRPPRPRPSTTTTTTESIPEWPWTEQTPPLPASPPPTEPTSPPPTRPPSPSTTRPTTRRPTDMLQLLGQQPQTTTTTTTTPAEEEMIEFPDRVLTTTVPPRTTTRPRTTTPRTTTTTSTTTPRTTTTSTTTTPRSTTPRRTTTTPPPPRRTTTRPRPAMVASRPITPPVCYAGDTAAPSDGPATAAISLWRRPSGLAAQGDVDVLPQDADEQSVEPAPYLPACSTEGCAGWSTGRWRKERSVPGDGYPLAVDEQVRVRLSTVRGGQLFVGLCAEAAGCAVIAVLGATNSSGLRFETRYTSTEDVADPRARVVSRAPAGGSAMLPSGRRYTVVVHRRSGQSRHDGYPMALGERVVVRLDVTRDGLLDVGLCGDRGCGVVRITGVDDNTMGWSSRITTTNSVTEERGQTLQQASGPGSFPVGGSFSFVVLRRTEWALDVWLEGDAEHKATVPLEPDRQRLIVDSDAGKTAFLRSAYLRCLPTCRRCLFR